MTTLSVPDRRLHHALVIYVQRVAGVCAAAQEMQANVPTAAVSGYRLASMGLAVYGRRDSSPARHDYHSAPRPAPCAPVNPLQCGRVRACERLDIGVIVPTTPLHFEREAGGNVDDGRPALEDAIRNILDASAEDDGITTFWPGFIDSGRGMPEAAAMASTETPNRRAIPYRVSPDSTTYVRTDVASAFFRSASQVFLPTTPSAASPTDF